MRPPTLAALLALVALAPFAQADALEVRALAGSFSPERIDARPGEAVTFANADDRAHTVTSAWDDGASLDVVLKRAQFVRVTFAQPGEYVVRCLPHSVVDELGRASGMVTRARVGHGDDGARRRAGFRDVAGARGRDPPRRAGRPLHHPRHGALRRRRKLAAAAPAMSASHHAAGTCAESAAAAGAAMNTGGNSSGSGALDTVGGGALDGVDARVTVVGVGGGAASATGTRYAVTFPYGSHRTPPASGTRSMSSSTLAPPCTSPPTSRTARMAPSRASSAWSAPNAFPWRTTPFVTLVGPNMRSP
jgi:plastocyanin